MADIMTLDELVCKGMDSILPDPVLWRYYKGLQKREIIAHGEIADDFLEYVVLPYIDMDKDGTHEPITIILSTVGGDLYDGFALIDAIEKAETPTTIRIISMAASMGALIAMAGKNNPNVTTECYPFAVGLIHSGSITIDGATFSAKDTYQFHEAYQQKIREYVLSHSKIDENTYDKMERKEYWMDSDEMLRLGVVDRII